MAVNENSYLMPMESYQKIDPLNARTLEHPNARTCFKLLVTHVIWHWELRIRWRNKRKNYKLIQWIKLVVCLWLLLCSMFLKELQCVYRFRLLLWFKKKSIDKHWKRKRYNNRKIERKIFVIRNWNINHPPPPREKNTQRKYKHNFDVLNVECGLRCSVRFI